MRSGSPWLACALVPPLLLSLSTPTRTSAQALTRDTRLPSAALRADLAVLRRAYTALHPGLYRYASPEQVEARFDSVDRYFAGDRTLGQAFLALTRLTASIRCGHSYPNFWNQPGRIATALFEGRDKLPLEFAWIDRRMVVLRDVSDQPRLERGTEVLSINGVSATAVLDSLLPLARADGGNDAKRVAYLEVRTPDKYHAFDVLYPLVFPTRDSIFTVRVRRVGARTIETVRLRAINGDERRARAATTDSEGSGDSPAWRYAESGGIGVVTMPTWALFDSKWNWRAWTDSIMDDLVARNVPDLVLDLRGNEGGLDAGNGFLARMTGAPLRLPRYERVVRAPRVPDDLRPVLETWDKSFFDWGTAAQPVDSLRWRLRRFDDPDGEATIAPRGTRYTGRVWVLVDASNSSATFQFALAVKESGVATLVGQPTGGNRRGINGGAFFFLRLPRTGLEVDLPLIAGIPPNAQPDGGVVPDLLVTPSLEQVASGVDAELAAVRIAVRAAEQSGTRR